MEVYMSDNLMDKIAGAIGIAISFIPLLLGALVVWFIGYLVAKAIAGVTRRGLMAARLDRFRYRELYRTCNTDPSLLY
jgi:hypothetical protein